MRDIDFIYLSTLATIQPARIQDIEKYSKQFFRSLVTEELSTQFRDIHHSFVEAGLVIAVRKGVYVVSQQANELIRTGGFGRGIDNRRLFLIKQIRKGIK
jgi:hypothetical protein